MVKNYNAKSLRESLKSRRQNLSGNRQAHQIRLIFTRMLTRLADHFEDRVILKGGFALETRIDRARTTRDIDLLITGSADGILGELNAAGSLDLGDFMRFTVTEGEKIQNVQYEGQRFDVICMMGNQEYGKFWIDISFGQAFGRTDLLPMKNYLEFADIAQTYIRTYPIETHIAEKLHAYSMEWETKTRVKDLPDLAILASIRPINWQILRASLENIFDIRGTHVLPEIFPAPPIQWNEIYERMAEENKLTWKNTSELFDAISQFLNPALGVKADLTWDPQTWKWR